MNRPRLAPALLALALFAPAAPAAEDKARETFEGLKRRLPGVVAEWAKKSGRWDPKREAGVELVRRVAVRPRIRLIRQRHFEYRDGLGSSHLLQGRDGGPTHLLPHIPHRASNDLEAQLAQERVVIPALLRGPSEIIRDRLVCLPKLQIRPHTQFQGIDIPASLVEMGGEDS